LDPVCHQGKLVIQRGKMEMEMEMEGKEAMDDHHLPTSPGPTLILCDLTMNQT